MGKYRQTGHDSNPELSVKPEAKPGANCLPIALPFYDTQGRRRGHVGYLASESTVRRFGVSDAKLGEGRQARVDWHQARSGVPRAISETASTLRKSNRRRAQYRKIQARR